MKKRILLCVIIAFINLSGTLIIDKLGMVQFLWISFLALQLYFMGNLSMNKKACIKLLLSFSMGVAWGQVSNYIWHQFHSSFSSFELNFLDAGILILCLCTGALIVFEKTIFGNLPATFAGLTVAILLWGRPDPFTGAGILGDKAIVTGIVIAISMYAYGILMAYMMDYVYSKCLKGLKLFRNKEEEF